MKKLAQTLAVVAVVLFLLLNLVNLVFGVSDPVFAGGLTAAVVLFLPMVILEMRK